MSAAQYGIAAPRRENVEKWRAEPALRQRAPMSPQHSDALLGGMWTVDLDEDDVYVHDTAQEIQDLLDDLIDVLDD